MKKSIFALLLSSIAHASPEIILAPVDHLYIPEGFDSNDSVEIVVTGTFPNTCYSRNKVDVSFLGDIIDVKVTAISPEQKNSVVEKNCPQLKVPFKEVVSSMKIFMLLWSMWRKKAIQMSFFTAGSTVTA